MPKYNIEAFHAWAECYIKDYGWFPVDPQNAFYWLPTSAIKLFYGKDFDDCKIMTLPDIEPKKVEKIKYLHIPQKIPHQALYLFKINRGTNSNKWY